MLDSPFLK